jgi:predicted dehydrogenase
MSEAKPLRVAIAGAGMISWHHLLAWQKLGERVRLVAVCDPDTARARKRADEFGIPHTYSDAETLLSSQEVDALDVASPRETHAAWVEAAAARGIATLCQKPLTPTLAEADALIAAVAGKSRLMVHENWRFRPWYRQARQWIDEGALGDLLLARMTLITSGMLPDAGGQRPAFVRQPFMAGEHRLMISEVLIHHLDTMRYLCGPLRVVAARTLHTVDAAKGETCAAIFLETGAGRPVDVTGTMAAPGFAPRASDRLELIGSKSSLVFDDFELRLLGDRPRSVRFDGAEGYQASFDAVIAHFVDGLRSGAPFETDPADNLETMRLVEHAYLAAGQRTSV